MPLLFVAAFLYWSVALGLGGLSLMAASAITSGAESAADFFPSAVEPVSGHALAEPDNSTFPIVVHLEESAEPEDVNDNAGAVAPIDTVDSSDDDGTGRLPGSNCSFGRDRLSPRSQKKDRVRSDELCSADLLAGGAGPSQGPEKNRLARPEVEFGFRRRAELRLGPSHVGSPRREKGAPVAFRCCRCGTSSCFRTWSCRCSSGARSRSARSRRRWPSDGGRAEGDLPLARSATPRPTSRCPRTSSRSGTVGTIIQLLRCPTGRSRFSSRGSGAPTHPALRPDRRLLHGRSRELPEVDERSRRARCAGPRGAATFETYVKLNKRIAPEILISVQTIEDPASWPTRWWASCR